MYKDLVMMLHEQAMRLPEKLGKNVELFGALTKAADAIEELSKPRWVPVTERLPEQREWVLVRSKLVKMRTDFISNDGNWYTTPGVTHWMPLPEPPKEE